PGGEVAPSSPPPLDRRDRAAPDFPAAAHREPDLVQQAKRELAPQKSRDQSPEGRGHPRRGQDSGAHDHGAKGADAVRFQDQRLRLADHPHGVGLVLALRRRLLIDRRRENSPLLDRPRIAEQHEHLRLRALALAQDRFGPLHVDPPLPSPAKPGEAGPRGRVHHDVAAVREPAKAPGPLEVAQAKLRKAGRGKGRPPRAREGANRRSQSGQGREEEAADRVGGAGEENPLWSVGRSHGRGSLSRPEAPSQGAPERPKLSDKHRWISYGRGFIQPLASRSASARPPASRASQSADGSIRPRGFGWNGLWAFFRRLSHSAKDQLGFRHRVRVTGPHAPQSATRRGTLAALP